MIHLDLFSGIGGFALAAERVWGKSVEHVFCDNDPFCQAILKKRWPHSLIYGDIRSIGLASLQADGILKTCKNDKNDTTRPLVCINVACPSKRLPAFTKSADKRCGKSSDDESVSLETSEYTDRITDSTEVRTQADTRKTLSNTQSVKGLLSEKPCVKYAKIAEHSKTGEQKYKPIIPTITNHCLSCGSAKSAITSGIKTTKLSLAYDKIDIITGGFPCQGFSLAGKRRGTDDPRYLWPEMRRVIQEFSPSYVVAENVRGLLSINGGLVFEQVCLDLEALGYEVQPFVIPACAINAPHRRDRVWIVGYKKPSPDAESQRIGGCADKECGTTERITESGQSEGCEIRSEGQGCSGDDSNVTDGSRKGGQCGRVEQRRNEAQRKEGLSGRDSWNESWIEIATRFCTLDDGLSRGLVRPRGWRNAALKAAGNAIVPAVAEQIFRAIKEVDHGHG